MASISRPLRGSSWRLLMGMAVDRRRGGCGWRRRGLRHCGVTAWAGMLEAGSGWFGNGGGGMFTARAGAILSGMLIMAGLVPATVARAAAAAPAFRAYGSAEQVYVLGLRPGARMSLLTASGHVLYTGGADSQGGLLFRKVPPGRGYRVRLQSDGAESGRVTVHSDRAAPWDPGIYRQSVPDSGYSYLTTRDGTKLAIDVHP